MYFQGEKKSVFYWVVGKIMTLLCLSMQKCVITFLTTEYNTTVITSHGDYRKSSYFFPFHTILLMQLSIQDTDAMYTPSTVLPLPDTPMLAVGNLLLEELCQL